MPSPIEDVVSVLPLPKHALTMAYLQNRLIATLIRIPLTILLYISYYIKDNPLVLRYRFGVKRRRVYVPSRRRGTYITTDIYTPTGGIDNTAISKVSGKAVGPVHVNWHGSGFVLKCFGADAEMCSHFANAMRCTVIDADYRKSPEHPFPAPVEDAEDVCRWVLSQPDKFDIRNLSVGGSSAGANIALATGVKLGPRLCAVTAFNPPCDFRVKSPRQAPEAHRHVIPPRVARYFDACYLVTASNRGTATLSPVCASLTRGELATRGPVYIATGTGDSLHVGGEHCIANLTEQGHPQAIFRSVRGEGHGFEKALSGISRQRALEVFEEVNTLICGSWLRDSKAKM